MITCYLLSKMKRLSHCVSGFKVVADSFDDIYKDMDDLMENPLDSEKELDLIISEILSPKIRTMGQKPPNSTKTSKDIEEAAIVHLKVLGKTKSATISIPSMDISVDMLKRRMINDGFTKNLAIVGNFQIGYLVDGVFHQIESTASLAGNIQTGGTLYVLAK
jgi:hypothetical protein